MWTKTRRNEEESERAGKGKQRMRRIVDSKKKRNTYIHKKELSQQLVCPIENWFFISIWIEYKVQKATTTKRHKSAQKENPVLQLLRRRRRCRCRCRCRCQRRRRCCCYVFRVFSHCVAFLICFPLFHGNSNKLCTNCCTMAAYANCRCELNFQWTKQQNRI